ncbi:MAG: leucyl aminopeptidase family protein [Nannocystaceae bacterium]|nr:leucyl aminopeptidase family protein [Nannocystaceae bacterium]
MLDALTTRDKPPATAIVALERSEQSKWLERQSAFVRNWLASTGFRAEHGKLALVPGRDGKLATVVLGLGDGSEPWDFAAPVGKLPPGRYRLERPLSPERASFAAMAWALASYGFGRYKSRERKPAVLVWPKGADPKHVARTVDAIVHGRDLVNTPASDMGPVELAAAAIALAKRFDARCDVIVGDGLLARNYPTIHAVGRASTRAPRLVDIRWGDASAPRLTLVGKGVCFDSGGLDLKTASGMKLMKKDMGGAASVMALAHMIMDAGLPVQLRVLLPIVENSVAGNAYRPGDVIRTRKGTTVEIGNTDAEGRLILCDALAEADSEDPDLLIDFATLTGAARVALGTDLPALFSTDDGVRDAILAAGVAQHDPLWALPLFAPYRKHLDSPIADLNNVGSVSEGGAITAALFLREFVAKQRRFVHIDTMAWNVSARPGRPAGGEILGVRGVFAALAERYRGPVASTPASPPSRRRRA